MSTDHPIRRVPGVLSFREKIPDREANQSLESWVSEDNTWWSYTSTNTYAYKRAQEPLDY